LFSFNTFFNRIFQCDHLCVGIDYLGFTRMHVSFKKFHLLLFCRLSVFNIFTMRTFKIIVVVFISNCLVNLVSAQQQANAQQQNQQPAAQQQNQQPVAQQQNQANFMKQAKPKLITRLLDSPECHDDIVKYCPSKGDQLSDLAVLKCMYNEVKDLNLIDKECHHVCF
jgi:hypothetical protein